MRFLQRRRRFDLLPIGKPRAGRVKHFQPAQNALPVIGGQPRRQIGIDFSQLFMQRRTALLGQTVTPMAAWRLIDDTRPASPITVKNVVVERSTRRRRAVSSCFE